MNNTVKEAKIPPIDEILAFTKEVGSISKTDLICLRR
jgi:hypothetical protein